jgi:hypothetical protein
MAMMWGLQIIVAFASVFLAVMGVPAAEDGKKVGMATALRCGCGYGTDDYVRMPVVDASAEMVFDASCPVVRAAGRINVPGTGWQRRD